MGALRSRIPVAALALGLAAAIAFDLRPGPVRLVAVFVAVPLLGAELATRRWVMALIAASLAGAAASSWRAGDTWRQSVVHVGAVAVVGGAAYARVRGGERERQRRLEAVNALGRAERVQAITEALFRTMSPAQVGKIVVNAGMAILGARSVALMLREGDRLRFAYAEGLPTDASRGPTSIPLSANLPVAEAVRERRAVFVSSPDELKERFAPPVAAPADCHSLAALHLAVGERVLGGLEFSFDEGHPLAQDRMTLMTELAQRAAQALERARLLEEAQRARLEAEYARRQAESRSVDAERLRQAVSALSTAAATEEVAQEIVRQAVEAAGADGGGLALADGPDNQLVLVPASDSAELTLPTRVAVRMEECLATGELAVVSGAGARGDSASSYALVPLLTAGRVLGVLCLSFPSDRPFSPRTRELMAELATESAEALERAKLYQSEQEARRRAEEARDRLRFLAEASVALASSLDHRSTVGRVCQLAVPALADWCGVALFDKGEADPVTSVPGGWIDLVDVLSRPTGQAPDPEATLLASVSRGQTVSVTRPDGDEVPFARKGDLRPLLDAAGLTSLVAAPLSSRGRVFGALVAASSGRGRSYGPEEVRLIEDVGRRVAAAVDSARLYAEQRDLAETLQKSLLPPRLPQIEGLDLAAAYRPGGEELEVGGDFYDVFEAGEGRWGLVVGDVCGSGVEAAVLTALVRYTARSSLLQLWSPSQALAVVNRAVLTEHEADRFCTVVCASLRLVKGVLRVTISSGGHPLPRVVRDDGRVEEVGRSGTLLGILENPDLFDETVELRKGETIIFYTDGVTEARAADGGMFGEERLDQVLQRGGDEPAAGMVKLLEDAVVGFADSLSDDVGLIAVQVNSEK